MAHLWIARRIERNQLKRGGEVSGRGISAQYECVKDILALTEGEFREDRAACADGRAGSWSCAVAVEEADLPIEAPITTPRCIPAKALALRCFCDVIVVANLRLSLASEILKLLATGLSNQGSLWSCYGEVAPRCVLAGGCVGVALLEEEAVAGPVGEGGKHEVVAVGVGITLLLAINFRFQAKDCSFNVGDWIKRAEESVVKEVTLGSLQSQPAAAAEHQDEH